MLVMKTSDSESEKNKHRREYNLKLTILVTISKFYTSPNTKM